MDWLIKQTMIIPTKFPLSPYSLPRLSSRTSWGRGGEKW